MNALTMAQAYHREKQEWKTLEEALLIVDDPDTKQGIFKEIYKEGRKSWKSGKSLNNWRRRARNECCSPWMVQRKRRGIN